MQQTQSSRSGALLIGALLIVAGVAAIVIRQSGYEFDWPVWVILPGLALFVAAFAVPVPAGSGLAVAGGIVTMVGLVLAVQEATDTYASWAYAWALIAPGGVGLALVLYGALTRHGDLVRGGFGALATGIVIFLVGFLFFEGVLRLNGNRFGDLTSFAIPGIVVAIGIIIILGALVPGPWRSQPRSGSAWNGWTGVGPGSTWSSGAGPARSDASEVVDVPLAGAADAEVRIAFGAGRLAVGAAQPGKLAEGTCIGGVSVSAPSPGRLRLATPNPGWNWNWGRVPFEWRVALTAEVPLRLEVETGASDSELDLSTLRVSDLRIRTGAAQTKVVLPAAAGLTHVSAEGGAAQVRFRVPDGVAARIQSVMALGSVDVDTTRFPRTPDGRGWASPGFDTAPNRVDIDIRGGAGQVTVG